MSQIFSSGNDIRSETALFVGLEVEKAGNL